MNVCLNSILGNTVSYNLYVHDCLTEDPGGAILESRVGIVEKLSHIKYQVIVMIDYHYSID